MPKPVTKIIGLEFSELELQKRMNISDLDLDNEFHWSIAVRFIEKEFEANHFKIYGLDSDYMTINEISGIGRTIFLEIM